jgi:hypothetical protein
MSRRGRSGILSFRWCFRVRLSGEDGLNIFPQRQDPPTSSTSWGTLSMLRSWRNFE